MRQCWLGEMRKKLEAKSTKIKTIQLSHSVNGLAQTRMVHVQRNYRPVQKVPVNELFG